MGKLVFLLSHHALFMRSDLTYMSQADCDDRSSFGAGTEETRFLVVYIGLQPLLYILLPGLSLSCGNELKRAFNHCSYPSFPAMPLSTQPCLLPSQGIVVNLLNPGLPFLIVSYAW